MTSGISLANKCQLLFGAAIVLILIGALAVPWARTQALVRQSQLDVSRQLAEAWLHDRAQLGVVEDSGSRPEQLEEFVKPGAGAPLLRLTLVRVENIETS